MILGEWVLANEICPNCSQLSLQENEGGYYCSCCQYKMSKDYSGGSSQMKSCDEEGVTDITLSLQAATLGVTKGGILPWQNSRVGLLESCKKKKR